MHDKGGQSVEQVRVVDPHHNAASTLLSDKRIGDTTHVGQWIGHPVTERPDEGAQRQGARRFCSHDPIRALAGRFGAPKYFASQRGLTHPRGSNDYHAGVPAGRAERAVNGD
jgi:hypothetical protein